MKNIQTMLEDIRQETEWTAFLTGRKTLSEAVMEAMRNVPRAQFVLPNLASMAFDNGPLPIGFGQTISQPFIVALMTEFLDIKEGRDSILEIGTGSGYQTAVLSQLAACVYTVELIDELSMEAEQRFQKLNYTNIQTRVGNGYEGWPEHAPYDGIIVTAAAPFIPDALIEQLKPEGRLVIPVGQPFGGQQLLLLEKHPHGHNAIIKILDVAFVPLIDHPKKRH